MTTPWAGRDGRREDVIHDTFKCHTVYQICARVRDHMRMRAMLKAGGCDPTASTGDSETLSMLVKLGGAMRLTFWLPPTGVIPTGLAATELAAAATDRPVCPLTAAVAASTNHITECNALLV